MRQKMTEFSSFLKERKIFINAKHQSNLEDQNLLLLEMVRKKTWNGASTWKPRMITRDKGKLLGCKGQSLFHPPAVPCHPFPGVQKLQVGAAG